MKVVVVLFAFLFSIGQTQTLQQILNTKTPYPITSNSASHEVIDPSECPNGKLLHLNLVARHGSRYPTSGDVKSFIALQKSLSANATAIQNPNYHWMASWVNPYTQEDAGLLNTLGELEHYNMSKRYMDRYFPQLNSKYSPLVYPIQSTYVTRTSRSANAFGYGLFEGTGTVGSNNYQPFVVVSSSADEDIVLRFFDNCPLYNTTVLNNASQNVDSNLYIAQYADEILAKVVTKLQVDTNQWVLTFKDVQTFYKACTFEASNDNDLTHFCSLFDLDDAYRFETMNDLSDYWIKGYGNAINYKISCPLLVDFWNSVQAVMKGNSVEKARLRFAHAETILPFVSLLGIFQDSFVLRWNSPLLDQRLWHSSIISPYAANVALGLYECSGVFKVKLSVNEYPVPIPNCGGGFYCLTDKFSSIYEQALSCPFNTLCGISRVSL